MSDPFRLRVLMALTEALKKINPNEGYEFDLSDYMETGEDPSPNPKTRVFRGRTVFGADDPIPMIAIMEFPQPLDQLKAQKDNPIITGPWDLMIQAFVKDDKDFPTDEAHRLMGEVKKVLAQEKIRKNPMTDRPDYLGLGDRKPNAITGFAIGPGSVRPSDEESPNPCFYLVLSLEIVEDTRRPYD